jgi:hypothetical protein
MDKKIYNRLFSGIEPRADRQKLESPLEEMFIHKFEKYLAPDVAIFPQFEVPTIAGTFRLDFLLTIADKKIAFECDGKEFHNEFRDEFRDGLILGTGTIDAIYRFRGKDLHTFLDDCIYLIYHFDKELFNNRYQLIFPQLISIDLKERLVERPLEYNEMTLLGYNAITDEGIHVGWLELRLERRDKNKPGHWKVLYDFAKHNPGHNIDQLITLRSKS